MSAPPPDESPPHSRSCLFLLSLGSCFPPGQPQEPGPPGEWEQRAWRAGAERRRSEELSIARELRGYGEEGAGQRAGSGRAARLRAPGGGERSGTLRNLEELNGYSRRKRGFAFRFGR
ncbi:LOW QUALITY PROTEIN: orexigenic neuropeptide QRFP [Guaruba guarouba]